jgi:hypothetical protein
LGSHECNHQYLLVVMKLILWLAMQELCWVTLKWRVVNKYKHKKWNQQYYSSVVAALWLYFQTWMFSFTKKTNKKSSHLIVAIAKINLNDKQALAIYTKKIKHQPSSKWNKKLLTSWALLVSDQSDHITLPLHPSMTTPYLYSWWRLNLGIAITKMDNLLKHITAVKMYSRHS